MKWLISGGSGFIGRALSASLQADGHEVVVLSRKGSAAAGGAPRRVAWVPGEAGTWTAELEGTDVVVNLAGAGVMDERWTAQRLALLRSSRVDSTRSLSEAIARAERKPGVLLSASAIGIYGMRMDDELLDEQGGKGSDVLAELCLAWEQAAEPARAAGVRVVHPRVGIVLGQGGGALPKMLPPFKAFVGGPIGSGHQWFSWVHIDDVVGALRFAAENDAVRGPMNAVAPQPVRMQEFARALGEVLGRPARMRVPALALRAVVGPGAEALLTGQRVSPAVLERSGYRFRYAALGDALRELLGAQRK